MLSGKEQELLIGISSLNSLYNQIMRARGTMQGLDDLPFVYFPFRRCAILDLGIMNKFRIGAALKSMEAHGLIVVTYERPSFNAIRKQDAIKTIEEGFGSHDIAIAKSAPNSLKGTFDNTLLTSLWMPDYIDEICRTTFHEGECPAKIVNPVPRGGKVIKLTPMGRVVADTLSMSNCSLDVMGILKKGFPWLFKPPGALPSPHGSPQAGP